MDSNSFPYPLLKIDDFAYNFKTERGLEYSCSFLSYAEYFPNHPEIAHRFYSFNLNLKSSAKKAFTGTDNRIAATVISIVSSFLESQINAVVYVCDNSDGKEAARAKKFLSWFNYFEYASEKIIQISNNFKIGDMMIYSSLLVHRKNNEIEKIILAYLELTSEEEK
jgi:hypothetical protein